MGLNYESFNDTCFFISAVNEAFEFLYLWSKGNYNGKDRASEYPPCCAYPPRISKTTIRLGYIFDSCYPILFQYILRNDKNMLFWELMYISTGHEWQENLYMFKDRPWHDGVRRRKLIFMQPFQQI